MRRNLYAIAMVAVTLALLAASGNGLAQTAGVTATGALAAGSPSVQFFGGGMGAGIEGVKGAPFSAEEINETTQVLSDGNRIIRKTTGRIYRDSEGRTRQEHTLQSPFTSETPGDAPRFVTINDPVAGAHYTLNSQNKTAQKMSFPSSERMASASKMRVLSLDPSGVPPQVSNRVARPIERPQSTTESLGTQTIEGFEAQGTRSTITIPAGQAGNERPIEIVSEQWNSPALHMSVLRKTNDPRMGETVYRLTNISLDEPDPSLFQIPPDYTVEERQLSGPGFFSISPGTK